MSINEAIIGSDKGLSPVRCQAFAWTNIDFLSIRTLVTYFSEIWIHDDVIKWKHFPQYWPFVMGIHRWPVDSFNRGQRRGALMIYLIFAWTNGWENNGRRWFETPSHSLWRHCYENTIFIKENLKMMSAKCRPFWCGLNMLIVYKQWQQIDV